MENELLRRIKELENENTFLKERIASHNPHKESIKDGIKESIKEDIKEEPNTIIYNSPFLDDTLLYYLKSVLGYNIKYDKKTFILRSVYAFSNDDTFEIVVENNKLLLKSTEYLREWSEFFNIYIKNGRSYCAFFSAVTLELYNRKTFGK